MADSLLNRAFWFLKKIRVYPLVLQTILLFIFVVVMALLGDHSEFSHQNLSTILLWNVWWPLVPVLFLLTGRIWCTICPFSSIAALAARLFGRSRSGSTAHEKRYGVYTTLFVFCCILAFDTGYGLHGNVKNTLLLLSCLLSLSALLSVVFNHRTYCSYVCPIGVFSRVYGRISLLQQRPPKSICTSCDSITHPQGTKEDWLFELECLTKCKRRSDLLFFHNPLTLIPRIENMDFCEAVAPICLVVLFFFHVFFGSGYFVNLHDQTTTILNLNMNLFAFSLALTVSSILFVLAAARISLHLAKRIGRIENLPIYRGWYTIAVLLVVFHLLLLSYDIEAVPLLPNPGQYVVLGAGFLGTLVALVVLFSRDTVLSWTRSLLVFATIGIPVVVAFLIALITIKYVEFFGC